MDSIYAVPGAVTLVEWFLGMLVYAFGWYRAQNRLNRVGDALALAGWITSLAGVVWLVWGVSPALAFSRSSLMSGLALSALAIHTVLIRRRTGRVSAGLVLGAALLAQAYSVGRLGWGVERTPAEVFLPLWAGLGAATWLVGAGALIVGASGIALTVALVRAKARLSPQQLSAALELAALEWPSVRMALTLVSLSLSVQLMRSWWGLGQVADRGLIWSLLTWLLLAAAYGLMQGVLPRRPARAMVILAGVSAIAALLAMAG